jgi:hypothetical protein
VGVSKVGGIFVHKTAEARFGKKSTISLRENTMKESLSAAQEAEAQQLAQAIAQAAHDDLLAIARALVAADNASLFGATEFKVRDLALRVAAKAYQQHLGPKKTATKGPA